MSSSQNQRPQQSRASSIYSVSSKTSDKSSLHLPRILCLHGGGTNARIFRAQCRVLSAQLQGKFRLCFAQAPLPSRPGPDVVSVYSKWGPFTAWLPSSLTSHHPSTDYFDSSPGSSFSSISSSRSSFSRSSSQSSFSEASLWDTSSQSSRRSSASTTSSWDSASDASPWSSSTGTSVDSTPCSTLDKETAISLVLGALQNAMDDDDAAGATGPWVGVLGFSQGAKLAASILLAQQTDGQDSHFSFKFGVLLAGRAPLVALHPGITRDGENVVDVDDEMVEWVTRLAREKETRLRIPTVHVLGRQDPNYRLHRRLYDDCCESSSTKLVEWDGGHRVPIQSKDVAQLVNQIVAVAQETGAISRRAR